MHKRDIRLIAKYLASTSTYVNFPDGNQRFTTPGVVYKPCIGKHIECYAYAYFSGGWYQAHADSIENAMLRTGYVITYTGCSVLWCSKLQTEIALSTTEAEYIALIKKIHKLIPLM